LAEVVLYYCGRAKGVEARRFYDPVPLEQLAKEGFIKELYPRKKPNPVQTVQVVQIVQAVSNAYALV